MVTLAANLLQVEEHLRAIDLLDQADTYLEVFWDIAKYLRASVSAQ